MTTSPVTPEDRLSFTLFLALAIHAVLIFGVGFARQVSAPAHSSLEVTLAYHPDKTAPKDADFIAQSNQQGSGSLDEKREQTTDQDSPFAGNQIKNVNLTPPSARAPSTSSRLMITSISATERSAPSKTAQESSDTSPLPKGERDSPTPLSQEIATLEARLAQQKQAYAKRPRVNFIDSVSAVAGYEALYINSFRQEVEAIGTRNFPPEALQKHIFGNVRLRVDILPSGKVQQIKLLHSSGFSLLDQAAMRSVRLAAPFAPFTQEMRKHYDVLAIIRTWKFDASSTVTSSYE